MARLFKRRLSPHALTPGEMLQVLAQLKLVALLQHSSIWLAVEPRVAWLLDLCCTGQKDGGPETAADVAAALGLPAEPPPPPPPPEPAPIGRGHRSRRPSAAPSEAAGAEQGPGIRQADGAAGQDGDGVGPAAAAGAGEGAAEGGLEGGIDQMTIDDMQQEGEPEQQQQQLGQAPGESVPPVLLDGAGAGQEPVGVEQSMEVEGVIEAVAGPGAPSQQQSGQAPDDPGSHGGGVSPAKKRARTDRQLGPDGGGGGPASTQPAQQEVHRASAAATDEHLDMGAEPVLEQQPQQPQQPGGVEGPGNQQSSGSRGRGGGAGGSRRPPPVLEPWRLERHVWVGVRLTLEECFFLAHVLGCLTVKKEEVGSHQAAAAAAGQQDQQRQCATLKDLDAQDLWAEACAIRPSFPVSMAAYLHLKAKGWLPRSGLLYGCQYVVYHLHPAFCHSLFAVRVIPVPPIPAAQQPPQVQDQEPHPQHHAQQQAYAGALQAQGQEGLNSTPLEWHDFQIAARVVGTVAKRLLLLYVQLPSGDASGGAHPAEPGPDHHTCLEAARVEERVVRRWVPDATRE